MSTKPKGWFSRRHNSSERHTDAHDTWEANQFEKKRSSKERQEVADKRTPQEQIRRLDSMFGEGVGAVKERAKLARKIAASQNNKKES